MTSFEVRVYDKDGNLKRVVSDEDARKAFHRGPKQKNNRKGKKCKICKEMFQPEHDTAKFCLLCRDTKVPDVASLKKYQRESGNG